MTTLKHRILEFLIEQETVRDAPTSNADSTLRITSRSPLRYSDVTTTPGKTGYSDHPSAPSAQTRRSTSRPTHLTPRLNDKIYAPYLSPKRLMLTQARTHGRYATTSHVNDLGAHRDLLTRYSGRPRLATRSGVRQITLYGTRTRLNGQVWLVLHRKRVHDVGHGTPVCHCWPSAVSVRLFVSVART